MNRGNCLLLQNINRREYFIFTKIKVFNRIFFLQSNQPILDAFEECASESSSSEEGDESSIADMADVEDSLLYKELKMDVNLKKMKKVTRSRLMMKRKLPNNVPV